MLFPTFLENQIFRGGVCLFVYSMNIQINKLHNVKVHENIVLVSLLTKKGNEYKST